mmetsp:Transcript_18031/g.48360  ORF Transcript_18031/g.48360 Transcript_18031/m.48360 type:complete len:198 (+) Transcript_18031:103-696(+)
MYGPDDAPSFGHGDAADTLPCASVASADVKENSAGVPTFGGVVRDSSAAAPAVEDELNLAASVDKVQEVMEQIAEFLVKFNPVEQRAILAPFMGPEGSATAFNDPTVEPYIDEARRFVSHYLAIYSECERELMLEKWRPAFDTASLSTATESFTPSVTPPGSVTPTAVTPREFLSARREVNEVYHSHSPAAPEAERP